jgi:hypothetical protein
MTKSRQTRPAPKALKTSLKPSATDLKVGTMVRVLSLELASPTQIEGKARLIAKVPGDVPHLWMVRFRGERRIRRRIVHPALATDLEAVLEALGSYYRANLMPALLRDSRWDAGIPDATAGRLHSISLRKKPVAARKPAAAVPNKKTVPRSTS